MLQSEHLRGLSNEVKRSSILVALEAPGAKFEDVIQDAVRRDRALDGYERVLQKSLSDVQVRKTEENRQIEAEMNKMLGEYRARIQANNEAIAKETERFSAWRTQKQQEEKTIADTVGYFVSENPITISGAPASPSPGPKTSEPRVNGEIMFKRLSRVFRSFFGFFISVAENPEIILEQNIRDMNDQVPRMNESIAMVKANVTLLEKEEAKYQNDLNDLTSKIKAAIQARP